MKVSGNTPQPFTFTKEVPAFTGGRMTSSRVNAVEKGKGSTPAGNRT